MVHCLNDSSCAHCWWEHCFCTPEDEPCWYPKGEKGGSDGKPSLSRAAGPGVLLAGTAAQVRQSGHFPDKPCCSQENPLWYCLKKVVLIAWVLKYTLDYLFYSLKQLLLGYSLTPWMTRPCLFKKRGIMFIHSQFSEALSVPTHRSL